MSENNPPTYKMPPLDIPRYEKVNQPTYKMLQLDITRYEKVKEIARQRREAAHGALRPQWGDIVKEMIDKCLKELERCAKTSQ